jgi:hypothetical protein
MAIYTGRIRIFNSRCSWLHQHRRIGLGATCYTPWVHPGVHVVYAISGKAHEDQCGWKASATAVEPDNSGNDGSYYLQASDGACVGSCHNSDVINQKHSWREFWHLWPCCAGDHSQSHIFLYCGWWNSSYWYYNISYIGLLYFITLTLGFCTSDPLTPSPPCLA